MTTIESNKVTLPKNAASVFDFLADANNHQQLMPYTVQNWKSSKNDCSFSIPNMGSLSLAFTERIKPHLLTITPTGKVPFAMSLQWKLEDTDTGCTAQLKIDADLNPFIKMMATGPLQSLVNHQVAQLQKAIH